MRTEYVEQVAARLVEQLRQGAAPWQRPWEPGELRAPYNAATGKEYRGFNSVWLRMQGHGDPRWLTFNQAADAGAGVRKGSRGTQIVYWKFTDERKAPDANGRPALDANGGRDAITVELERPRSFMAVVFNASQIDGLPPPEAMALRPEPERHARAEAIMTGSGARIAHVAGERAFYRPGDDLIVLPPRTQFATADRLYATALHELGHWSGHGSRLDRDLTHPFGSAGYAREELRAEIASLITGERLEIGHDPGQHAAYAAHWIKALEEDPREIFRAAADAGKIADYLMEFEREREQTMEKETGAQQARQTTAVEHGTPAKAAPGRVYLAVPYREKDEARAAAMSAGVRIAFDRDAMAWWAPESADLSPLAKWKADAARVVSQPARSVEEQFGDAIRGAGLALEGLPVMDGNIHRVPVAGEAAGKTSGSYAGHLGGVTPGGYIQNFKSGETVNWKPEGAAKALTPGERARLQAEARRDRARREAALAAKHEAAAAAAQALWMAAPPATADNAYCRARAIDNPAALGLRVVPEAVPETAAAHGIRIARNAQEAKAMRAAEPDARVFMAGDLLIAGRDIDGQIRTLQSINPDFKSFMKGGRKAGVFAVIGDGIADSPKPMVWIDASPSQDLILAEGVATASAVSKGLEGAHVIVAFDSGNLDAVAAALRERYPTRTMIIAADNDHLAKSDIGNVGLTKANDAAARHGAGVAAPPFAKGEAGSDWRDYEAAHGAEAMQRKLAEAMAVARRDAIVNAERLETLARQREMDARNDPATSGDDERVAREHGKAAEEIADAAARREEIVGALDRGQKSMPASVGHGISELRDKVAEERQEVRSRPALSLAETDTAKPDPAPASPLRPATANRRQRRREIDMEL